MTSPATAPLLALHRASLARAAFVDDTIVAEEHMIPSDTPGIGLSLRAKRPARLTDFRPQRTVLFVHGSSYPAHTAYDLPHHDLSWLDHLARHGYEAWCLDVRGYGRSTRPPDMDRAPAEGAPVARTDARAGQASAGHNPSRTCRTSGGRGGTLARPRPFADQPSGVGRSRGEALRPHRPARRACGGPEC